MATAEPAEDRPGPDDHPFGSVGLSVPAAERRIAAFTGQALVNAAELTAAGHRFLTVTHGDPQDREQQELVTTLSAAAWATARVRSVSGNDYLTIHVRPPRERGEPAAEEVVTQLEGLAYELNPGWWRIRRSAR